MARRAMHSGGLNAAREREEEGGRCERVLVVDGRRRIDGEEQKSGEGMMSL